MARPVHDIERVLAVRQQETRAVDRVDGLDDHTDADPAQQVCRDPEIFREGLKAAGAAVSVPFGVARQYVDVTRPERRRDVACRLRRPSEILLPARRCGEAGAIGSPAAIINAVVDALDGRNIAMPATSEQVWRAVKGE